MYAHTFRNVIDERSNEHSVCHKRSQSWPIGKRARTSGIMQSECKRNRTSLFSSPWPFNWENIFLRIPPLVFLLIRDVIQSYGTEVSLYFWQRFRLIDLLAIRVTGRPSPTGNAKCSICALPRSEKSANRRLWAMSISSRGRSQSRLI